MKISKQARRDAKQLFRSCLSKGVLDEQRVRDTVSAVAKGKPRGYLGKRFLASIEGDSPIFADTKIGTVPAS